MPIKGAFRFIIQPAAGYPHGRPNIVAMPQAPRPSSEKDFNAKAGSRPQAFAVLLKEAGRIRRNLDMAEAAQRKDWAAVEKLYDAGADPLHRNMAALRAIFDSGDLEAAKLAEKMKDLPVEFVADLSLVAAAEEGKRETVDYILARNPPEQIVDLALLAALRKDRTEITDLLYDRLKHAESGEHILVEMLLHRPELYAEATAGRKTPPDYILHFVRACEAKDQAAMSRALDAMIMHRDTFGPNIKRHADEFDIGMGHQEALMILVQSGHIPAMARYYDTFPDLCPTNLEMFMVIALAVSPPGIDPLPPIIEKFKPEAKVADFAFTYAAQLGNLSSLKYLSKAYPELAQKNSKVLLGACAAQKTPEPFFDALKAGFLLPAKSVEKAELLAESLMSGNAAVTAHLEAEMLVTPAAALRLQAYHDLKVLKRAAELSGNWHFRDDIVFWTALTQGDRAVLAAVPQNEKISTAQPYLVTDALNAVIRRGEFDLLQLALDRADWDAPARELAFAACLAAPEALAKFDFTSFPPHALSREDLRAIAAGSRSDETLALLEAKGFGIPAVEGLRAAVENNSVVMAEHLLAKGADLAAAAPALLAALDKSAGLPVLDVVEKWAVRACDVPAPGLAAQIAAASPEDLFKGTDSLAVAAAYAGEFPAVMKKIAAKGNAFDPALFASTRDAHGNSVLDIQGAHGRLNEVLAPEIWAGRDADTFIRDNTPPCYRAQCDFAGLQASIARLRLKQRGKIGPADFKGP